MVDSIKSIAARIGAVCYSDPFLPTTDDTAEKSVLTRAMRWLAVPTSRQIGQVDRARNRREHRTSEGRVSSHYRPQTA
jgi:hypothetical protein